MAFSVLSENALGMVKDWSQAHGFVVVVSTRVGLGEVGCFPVVGQSHELLTANPKK